MPVDKVNAPTPETDGEESVEQVEQNAAPGQAEDAPAEQLSVLQAALRSEREKRIEQERSYSELRSKFNARDSEIARLRAEQARLAAGQGEDTSGNIDTLSGELANEVVATREEVAWMRFQQNHPKYGEFWDEMKAIAADPTYKRTIETFRRAPGGQVVLDTFATLHNAYNEVELRRIRKAQTGSVERKAASDTTNKQIKARATISGDSAASEDEGSITDAGLLALLRDPSDNYDEIIKHPAFKQFTDPNDPPRGI
jgi:hypothetical protein